MITQLQEILRQVDIFGQSINLSFRQREKYQTSFGGFLSMCMIATIISFFYSNILSFFNMTSVTSNEQLVFEDSPELLVLDPSSFMFAIQIEQQDFINNPFFNVTIEQRHYHRYDNGTQYKYPSQYIDLVQCTYNHFQMIFEKYNIKFEEQYNKLNISNFLCPNLNNENSLNLTVGGTWASTDYYFLKFSVKNCVNDSESTFSWKPTCKSPEQIKEATQNWGSFRFQLYQINYLVNSQKPRDYIQPLLSTDTFYSFVPNTMFIQSDIFFRYKEVNSDRGILMYPDIEKEIYPYREHGDQRDQISINYLTQNNYGAFYFSRSPYKYIIQRDFMRLDELLSYLGGFTQFMIVIVGIFVSIYNREHLKISMANDLYEFDMSLKKQNAKQSHLSNIITEAKQKIIFQKRQSKKQIDSIGQSPDLCLNINQQNEGIDNDQYENQNYQKKILNTNQTVPDKPMITQMKNQVSKYFDQFCQYVKQKYKVKIGLRMIISSFLPFDCLKNDDGIVVEKAINQVNKELDIEYILQQLHEIQKFKKILLDNNQIGIFNFSQKPIIALYQDSQMRRRTKIIVADIDTKSQEFALFKQFNDLVNAFHQIQKQEMKGEYQQININQRLLELLGSSLSQILEKEIALKEQMILCEEDKIDHFPSNQG
ncbi:unnamed protein product [Paramecium primaurelia]|uniref:Transmembrane protein n=1 Tax=Paramecium primaurelia TaxID=5886 RepID=A0A8S1NU32_PARPR|nr:unnamed protein product [Paramecium primaurelia]